ncbi:MAG TPA: phage baseplate assembly protein V [Egicoccus sp.]|nr:phage baseplate assembly protein V [Egicoccus sp.]HSK21533.1 phage baseplate assembly protein V [Egicoccus sp.]
MPSVVKTPIVPVVKVDGSVLDIGDTYLSYLRASSSLNGPGSVTLHLITDDLSALGSTKLQVGKPLEIQLPKGTSAVKTVFKGDVTTVGFSSFGAQQSNTLIVEGLESSHRLASASEFKAYLKQKRSDVAKAIAGRHGLATSEIKTTDPQEPYLLQHGNDFDCLSELAAEIGFEWFVNDGKLYFREQGTEQPVTLKPSDDTLLSVSVRYTGTPVASAVKVHGWDPAGQKVFTGAASKVGSPGDLLNSDASFVRTNYGKAKTAFGKDLEIATMPTPSKAAADTRAGAVARSMIGSGLALEGETYGNPDLRPGAYVKLQDLGSAVDGKYYLTEVVHEFTQASDTRTLFYSSGHRPEKATDVRSSTEQWSGGLVIGVVTNLKDDENLGRVKVKFPTLGGVTESSWARLVSVGAGNQYGLDVMPEIGDEVVVGFEGGDTRFPFVLGGLWSGKNKHPDTTARDNGKVKKRLYKSVAGHQIVFGEDSGTAATFGITMQTKAGKAKLDLTEEKITLEADAGNEMVIKGGGSEITFGKNGALAIKCTKLSIDAQQAIEVKSSGGDVTLKGVNVKGQGTAGFELKGAMGKVESSGPLTVKGAIVQIN